MIIYMPEPLKLLEESKSSEHITLTLPSGGYINVEMLGERQVKVVNVVSTDPMDYMNNKIQPGNLLELNLKI